MKFINKNTISFDRNTAEKTGINSAIILSRLIEIHSHLISNDKLPKDGYFHCTTEHLEDLTTMSYKVQTNAIKILVENGLIKLVRREGNIRYFKIQFDSLTEFYGNGEESEKSELIDETKNSNNYNNISKKGHQLKLVKKYYKRKFKEENLPEANSDKENSDSISDSDFTIRENSDKEIVGNNKELSIGKNSYIKEEEDNNINNNININISSSSLNTKSSKINKEMPLGKGRVDNIEGLDEIFKSTLEDFLMAKGFSSHMIGLTIKQFISKGLKKFRMFDLESAYDKMIHYNEHVKRVIFPPVFFANGVSMSLPKNKKVQVDIPEPVGELPFYNWLES